MSDRLLGMQAGNPNRIVKELVVIEFDSRGKKMIHRITLMSFALLLVLGSIGQAKADVPTIVSINQLLGSAANYAVLGIGSSSAGNTAGTLNNSLVTINGNQGVGFGGRVINMAPSSVNGKSFSTRTVSTVGQAIWADLCPPMLGS